MIFIANFLVAVVAVLHVYFLILEMFLWTRPLGLKTFRNSIEKATESAVLAANQGLYNGFLAARPRLGPAPSQSGVCAPDQDFLSALRDRGWRLWRGDRQPPDPLRAGGARSARPGPALAGLTGSPFRHCLALPNPFRHTRW
jgi:hypothetical protein